MDEAQIRNNVIHRLKAKVKNPKVVFSYEDRFTKGIPDRALVLDGITSYWEFKYQGLLEALDLVQQATLQDLVEAGSPAYYFLVTKSKELYILHPDNLGTIAQRVYSPEMGASLILKYHYEMAPTPSIKFFKLPRIQVPITPEPMSHFKGVEVHHTEIQPPLLTGGIPETITIYYTRGFPDRELVR